MQRAVTATCAQFTAWRRPVRFVSSLLVPSEADAIFLFEGTEAAHVRDVCEAAQLPFTRIVEVIECLNEQPSDGQAESREQCPQ